MYLKLFLFGLIVHLILFYSVFDIFYASPIVTNARSHAISAGEGPAQRLVVFSADGLRSRAFFDHPDRSPYLHGLIRSNKAVYGVSQSHVPTESRPGHVAIFAGFFEDVSAVAKGWKKNPIKFDSIFNRTQRAWLFGSPDIVLMFGEELEHATNYYYSAHEEQLFDSDASGLDTWVFDRVKDLFKNPSDHLQQSKSIFFLHLLGLDSNGHSHKPRSTQYLNNIRIVDDGIREMVDLFESHFKDQRTVYLFTSDHGMSDFGSHGSGSEDETLTPLIVWGSGIKPHNSKQVIDQIDLTPLQAALINIPVPTNNFGVLPLNFLNTTNKYKFQAACANLKQMVEQYGLKRSERRANSLPFMFKEYPGFQTSALNRVEQNLLGLTNKQRYDMAAQQCIEWIPKIRKAFLYFHRYNRGTLGLAISLTFILWNAFIYTVFSRPQVELKNIWIPSRAFAIVIGVEVLLGLYQKWPLTHLVYVVLPVYLASLIGRLINLTPMLCINTVLGLHNNLKMHLLGYFVGFGILLITFVSSFFHRAIVSMLLIFVAPMPYLTANYTKWSKIWAISCLLLAIFPQCQPVGQTPNVYLVIVSTLLWTSCLSYYRQKYSRSSARLFDYFIVINLLTSIMIAYSNYSWTSMSSTPLMVRLFSWFSVTFNFLVPLLADSYLCDRLVLWMSAVNVPFSLMSLSYEPVFYLIFCILLFSYIQLYRSNLGSERLLNLRHGNKKSNATIFGPFILDEWRQAITLLALIIIAFFGTGNLSSLNSFNPSFIRNFISTFSPFTMAVLLIGKITLPFFIIAFTFSLILYADRDQVPERISVLLFIISDLMAMTFYHCLKDEGSWLEIGISISNYVICLAMAVIFFILFHFSNKIFVLKPFDLYNLKALDDNKVL